MTNGTRRGWGVSVTPRPLFTPRKDPVPIVQEAGWAPGSDLDRCGKSRPPTGIRSPDRPARIQSLLSYPAHSGLYGERIIEWSIGGMPRGPWQIQHRLPWYPSGIYGGQSSSLAGLSRVPLLSFHHSAFFNWAFCVSLHVLDRHFVVRWSGWVIWC